MKGLGQRIRRLTLLPTILIFAATARAEEKPNQLITFLNATTISGNVISSASFGGTTLQPGLYEGWVTNRVIGSQTLRLALVLNQDGTGVCELDGFNPQTHILVSYFRGNYTNAPNGAIAGKFAGQGGRFRGRVNSPMDGAKLHLLALSGGKLRIRQITLARVGDSQSSSIVPPSPLH